MSERPQWLPHDVDLEKPSAARCYDYFLGGSHNFAADRELAREVQRRVPAIRDLARNNRDFLRRVVQYCLDQGIRQFLDIGSGIPTVGNVHEIAQLIEPTARVVYVDNEPVAVTHSLNILEDNQYATMVHGDLLEPDQILRSPEALRLIDFSEPVAVLMVALLHFVPESARPGEIIQQFRQELAPGSFLGISHGTGEDYPDLVGPVVELYRNTNNPITLRSREQVISLLSGFELVEPGVVYVPEWHPDTAEDVWEDPAQSVIYGAVGRKV